MEAKEVAHRCMWFNITPMRDERNTKSQVHKFTSRKEIKTHQTVIRSFGTNSRRRTQNKIDSHTDKRKEESKKNQTKIKVIVSGWKSSREWDNIPHLGDHLEIT